MAVVSDTKTEIIHRKISHTGSGVLKEIKSDEIKNDQGEIRINLLRAKSVNFSNLINFATTGDE
jgi:hypothetical protein